MKVVSLAQIDPEWRRLLSPLTLAEGLDPSWVSTRHHRIIDKEFRALIAPGSQTDCLIITCPPRHGKSTYLSHWAPAHYLLRNPYRRVMLCSYGMRLAKWLSRRVRDRVHAVSPLFGLRGVKGTVSAAEDWEMDVDGPAGGMLASGVEGSITGRGANLLLIDDYIRKGKDAASQTLRDNQWEWFQSTASTRREPGGKICILATPWHEDDLIGRILQQRDDIGMNVRRVALQALREDDGVTKDPLGRAEGEALWPEQWPAEVLQKQKRTMGPYWWGAQYQGNPSTYGRNHWPASYFSNIWASEAEWPVNAPLSVVVLDPSKGAHDDTGDFQAICYAAYTGGKLWLDFDVDRRPIPSMMRAMAAFCKERRPSMIGIESNVWQELLAMPFVDACREIDYEVSVPELMNNSTSKLVRIMRLATYFDARVLRIRRNAGGEEFLRQAKAFPNGEYDDALDAAEMAIRLLSYFVVGSWQDPDDGSVLIAA